MAYCRMWAWKSKQLTTIMHQWYNAIDSSFLRAILMSLPCYLTCYLTRVVVWKVSPPNPCLAVSVSRIVVFQLFVDILVAPMSTAGFQHLRHPAGCQSMVKPEESPPSILVVREFSTCVVLRTWPEFPAPCAWTGCHLVPSDRSNWRFWASVTQTPSCAASRQAWLWVSGTLCLQIFGFCFLRRTVNSRINSRIFGYSLEP